MAPGDRWFFDAIAPVYDRLMPGADRDALNAPLRETTGPVRRVVEVGGGTGRALRVVDAEDRVLVDASPGMIRRAPAGVEPVLGDAARLPLRDGGVDAALVVDALHHFPDAPAAIAEAARVLRPGGVLVVRDFDPATLGGRVLAALEHAIRMQSTFLTADDVAALAADAGLDASIEDRGVVSTVVARKPGP